VTTPEEGFESARWLVEWAKTQFEELDALVSSYCESSPAVVINERNRKTDCVEMKIRTVKPLPPRIRGLANNIIKDLRDALDQATNAASFVIRGKQRRNAHFPFGSSPDDFDDAVQKGPCADIPAELYPVLKSYEPYPSGDGYSGGDDILRHLGSVSGPHKHRITLSPAVDTGDAQISNFDLEVGSGGMTVFPSGGAHNEVVVLSVGRNSKARVDLRYTVRVTFADGKLKGVPVNAYLQECCARVGKIVQDLQAQAFEIGPRKL
jgi:hypothetical protein